MERDPKYNLAVACDIEIGEYLRSIGFDTSDLAIDVDPITIENVLGYLGAPQTDMPIEFVVGMTRKGDGSTSPVAVGMATLHKDSHVRADLAIIDPTSHRLTGDESYWNKIALHELQHVTDYLSPEPNAHDRHDAKLKERYTRRVITACTISGVLPIFGAHMIVEKHQELDLSNKASIYMLGATAALFIVTKAGDKMLSFAKKTHYEKSALEKRALAAEDKASMFPWVVSLRLPTDRTFYEQR